jgi:hypothetical protein
MVDKLSKLLDSVKLEYNSLISSEKINKVDDEIDLQIDNKFNIIHDQVDNAADVFLMAIEQYINNFSSHLNDTIIKDDLPPGEAAGEIVDVKKKIKDLMSNLESMITYTSKNEEILNYIKTTPLNKLVKINKKEDRIEFNTFKLDKEAIFKGNSAAISLTWSQSQASIKNTAKISNNGKTIAIDSTSCWNFQCSEEQLESGINEIELQVEELTGDSHFYFGICNEYKVINGNNGCLCCQNPNTWYYDRNGQISCNNVLNSGKIAVTIKPNFTVKLIVDVDNKTIIFKEDDLESSPFPINGNKFRLLVSNCNSYKGKITIL